VVCGGPSVTLSPDRWRSIANVLIIGEAERIWPQFTEDFLQGAYSHEYRESERFDLSISPIPDFSGYSKESITKYFFGIVQTSRGCPYDCEFCDVHVYLGHKMRYKPINKIIQEVKQMQRLGLRYIFLADDNFSAGRTKACEILGALRDWNNDQIDPVVFITQLSIDVARDDDFLRLAAEAGLIRVLVGIESPNVESLKETSKYHNVRSNMMEDLRKFSQFGIQVIGSTIVGFDSDDLSIFQMQFDFFMQTGISQVLVHPLQARDSTRLKERMILEKRYIDWDTDDAVENQFKLFESFTIIPKQMRIEQLRQGAYWLVWNLYKLDNVKQRIANFFRDFDSSPHNISIRSSRKKLSLKKIIKFLRMFILFFSETTSDGKKILREIIRIARKSSYPRKWEIVVSQLSIAKNAQDMLSNQYYQIEKIEYPQ
jgi:radical SAM superfamily enzyme YgiQ (UPF0313 family)